MNRRTLLAWLAIAIVSGKLSADPYPYDNYDDALAEAVRTDRLAILFFTGSDWCHWCKKLERELFADEAFQESLRPIAVFVEIDFPRRRSIHPKQALRNLQLKSRFKVEAFPTVIVFDPRENVELLRHAYLSTTPESYLATLRRLTRSRNRLR